MSPIEVRLKAALWDHRYQSAVTGQMRGMMSHQVDALTETLLGFLREEMNRAAVGAGRFSPSAGVFVDWYAEQEFSGSVEEVQG